MIIQAVTLWYKYNKKDDVFIFNHLENGSSDDSKPQPLGDYPLQNDWKNYEWFKTFAWLRNNVLVNEFYTFDGVQIQAGTPEFEPRLR